MSRPSNASGWQAAAASTRGASHRRSGLPNQDAFASWTRKEDGQKAILAVSDGHGAHQHFRSQVGSRLAVGIAVSVISGLIDDANAVGMGAAASGVPDADLPRRLVTAWSQSVERHLRVNPLSQEERDALAFGERGSDAQDPILAYGATLLVVVATTEYVEYLQLGDGDILTVDADGSTTRPLPQDERLIANQTTSLCRPEAWNDFRRLRRTCAESPPPVLVLVSTDGYSNSFRSEGDFLLIGRDYLKLACRDSLDDIRRDLPAILDEASEKGSGDDITLGILLRPSGLPRQAAGNLGSPREDVSRYEEPTVERSRSGLPTSDGRAPKPRPAAFVLSLLALFLALASVRFWWPDQGSTSPPASNPDPDLAQPAPSPSRPAGWVLMLGTDVQVLLEPSLVISLSDLKTSAKPDSGDFAEVLETGPSIRLKNLSDQEWKVSEGGRKQRIPPGEILEIGQAAEIDIGWTRARIKPLSELEDPGDGTQRPDAGKTAGPDGPRSGEAVDLDAKRSGASPSRNPR